MCSGVASGGVGAPVGTFWVATLFWLEIDFLKDFETNFSLLLLNKFCYNSFFSFQFLRLEALYW